MAKTKTRYVKVKGKTKWGTEVTKWKDSKTGEILDYIPLGSNIERKGGELGISELPEDVKASVREKQKEWREPPETGGEGIIGGVLPDYDLLDQAVERQRAYEAELANEKELSSETPVKSAVKIPVSDQDLQAGKRKMNHEKSKLKLDAQFYYGEQAHIDIGINFDETKSYNNYYTNTSVDNDSTDDGSMLEVEGDGKQDFSLERSHEEDRQGEIAAEEQQAKEDFLSKSNNAAMKSGQFDPDELWELQKKHRSGEWRNKSDVDTGKSITGKTFTKAGK